MTDFKRTAPRTHIAASLVCVFGGGSFLKRLCIGGQSGLLNRLRASINTEHIRATHKL